MHGLIDPLARFDVIEAGDDDLELAEEVSVEILDRVSVWGDSDALDTILYEIGCYVRLVLAYVLLAEEELSVQVGHIYPVEVDHVDVSDARKRQIF